LDVPESRAWPDDNPAGIARMAQSPKGFRRGETAPPDGSSPTAASVGVSFSNPTPPSLPSVGPESPDQLEPVPGPEGEPPLDPAVLSDETLAVATDPFGGHPEWSGWTKKVEIEPMPPHSTPDPSLEAAPAAAATAWSIPSLDFEAAAREGKGEPLFRLEGPEGDEPKDLSGIAGHRVHSRSAAQDEASTAVAEGAPAKPPPHNYSQFVAVIVVLIVLNVPAILVLRDYWTEKTAPEDPTIVDGTRLITPEDLAVITDEMWSRPGQAETVLEEWRLSREEYSRLMVEVNTDNEMNARYLKTRRTGPRGERKADLRLNASPTPVPVASSDSESGEAAPEEVTPESTREPTDAPAPSTPEPSVSDSPRTSPESPVPDP
jgi:hypothetical protein